MIKKIDERDTMFARMGWTKNSKEYLDYYKNNPDKKENDDRIREMPNICGEGTVMYDEVLAPIADANFEFLDNIRHLSSPKANDKKVEISKAYASKLLKGLALNYGAIEAYIVEMKDIYFYSRRGRHSENYNEEVKCDHKYGIVFACPMNIDIINQSPKISAVSETSKVYVDCAIVGMQLAFYLSNLGYNSFNHMDSNYLVNTVAIANDTPIGEVGRHGLIVNPKYGSSLRLGVVTTDLPLIADCNIDYGIRKEFCAKCDLCAKTCPGKAIDKGDDSNKWHTNQEQCYERWRVLGTDCGICISSCPFSQGVDMNLLKEGKVQEMLDIHKKKYGVRNYINDIPEYMKDNNKEPMNFQ